MFKPNETLAICGALLAGLSLLATPVLNWLLPLLGVEVPLWVRIADLAMLAVGVGGIIAFVPPRTDKPNDPAGQSAGPEPER